MSDAATVKWGWVKTWIPIMLTFATAMLSVALYAASIDKAVSRQGDRIDRVEKDGDFLRDELRAIRQEIAETRRQNDQDHKEILLRLK